MHNWKRRVFRALAAFALSLLILYPASHAFLRLNKTLVYRWYILEADHYPWPEQTDIGHRPISECLASDELQTRDKWLRAVFAAQIDLDLIFRCALRRARGSCHLDETYEDFLLRLEADIIKWMNE